MSTTPAKVSAIRQMIDLVKSQVDSLPPEHRATLAPLLQALLQLWDNQFGEAMPTKAVEAEGEKPDAASRSYSAQWSISKKFAFLLNRHQRFLNLREVADLIAEAEGLSPDAKKELPPKLSQALAPSKKSGELVKYQVGSQNRNTYWGRKDWLEAENTPKKGREGNPKYLTNADGGNTVLDFAG